MKQRKASMENVPNPKLGKSHMDVKKAFRVEDLNINKPISVIPSRQVYKPTLEAFDNRKDSAGSVGDLKEITVEQINAIDSEVIPEQQQYFSETSDLKTEDQEMPTQP